MKRIAPYLLYTSLLLTTACVKEPLPNDPNSLYNGKTITFTLSNSSESTQTTKATRALDDPLDNEKVINRIDVLFYDENGTELLFYPTTSQLTNDGGKVTIRIPELIADEKLFGRTCKVYMMGNCQLDRVELTGKTLDELKQIEMTNGSAQAFNTPTAPKDFFMESDELTVMLSMQRSQNLGKIILKRAAAKIIVDIIKATITGYTPGKATVKIVNYLDKTKLGNKYQYQGPQEMYKLGTRTLTANGNDNKSYSMDATNPIYTYSNDWEFDIDRETYVLIEFEWTENSTSTIKNYYYRIPFSFLQNSDDQTVNKYRVRRNFIYQFGVNISQLGGLDPADAVDLTTNFDLIDWTNRTIDISILSYHYLFVYNRFVDIYNTNNNTWEYKSSLPIHIAIQKVYCNYYSADGTINEKVYSSSDTEYPLISQSIVNDKTYFTFNSKVPINYVPLYITAKISNQAQLFSDVTLTIYPKVYVTSSPSLGGPTGSTTMPNGILPTNATSVMSNGQRIYRAGSYTLPDNGTTDGTNVDVGTNNSAGATGQTNSNFFIIHVSSRDIGDILEGVLIGDPTQRIDHPGTGSGANITQWRAFCPNYYQTLTDDANNNIISPQFTIATQRGITSVDKTATTARQRCNTYRESQYPGGSWRVPTYAELSLVRKMQLDPNSAIKELFQTSATTGWRTARGNWSIVLGDTNDGTAFLNTTADQSVRCVHDNWRD